MSENGAQPVFYYDFASPYSYLAAERINQLLPVVPEWRPIFFGALLREIGRTPWSMREETKAAGMADCEQRALERGLPAIRWPRGWPIDSYSVMPARVAVYAGLSGRAVAFSLAAFRQVFAAGRDMTDVDNVLIAAAACELHPKAVLKGLEQQTVKDRLRAHTDEAIARGVTGIPTVAVGDELYWGDDRLEEAAAALGSTP